MDLVSLLANGDASDRINIVSNRGLEYVQAEYIRPTEHIDFSKEDSRLRYRFIRLDQPGFHWLEGKRHFTIRQLEHPIGNKLLTGFCAQVSNADEIDAYQHSIKVSKPGGIWEFGLRHYGPAVSGKMCAGSWWNVYYRREHGQFKIWRVEEDVT